MTDEEYRGYLARTEFFPATTRTAEGIHGLMWSKNMFIDIPEALLQYTKNVDGKGNDFYKFSNDSSWDSMITNWGGILDDAPSGEGLSQLEAEQFGVLPYMSYYKAEQIINVLTAIRGRREIITKIVLYETEEVLTVDEFTTETKDRYRVLSLDENGDYKVTMYDEAYRIMSEFYPMRFGRKLKEIPFFFMPNNTPVLPMFYPLVCVNNAWYHKSADLENGLHWTGVPTPICIGYTPETIVDPLSGKEVPKYDLKLGGSKVVYFPQGVTDVRYLEFGGAGLSQLQSAMQNDEERMAILGARIISAEKKGVESAETARIHRAGENSVVATFAMELSKVLTNALRFMLEWTVGHEIDDTIEVKINTDYDASRMNTQELTAIVSAWQSGLISKQVAFDNLKQGEIIPSSMTFEKHEEQIREEKEKNLDNNQVLTSHFNQNINEDENEDLDDNSDNE